MIHQDQLVELFGQANPVPDPSVYGDGDDVVVRLETFEQWSEPMQTIELEDKEPAIEQPDMDQRGWYAGIAAVLVVVLGLGVAMVTYQRPSDVASPEMAAVQEPFNALNAGSFETFAASFTGEAQAALYDWQNQYEADIVANLTWSTEICSHEGADAEGFTLIACDMSRSTDFLEAGGVTHTGRSVFHVDENLKIVAWDDHMTKSDQYFQTRFIAWMNAEQDDHFGAWNVAVDVDHGWWNRTPAVMEVALQYVDEFVAQSDRYPIAP